MHESEVREDRDDRARDVGVRGSGAGEGGVHAFVGGGHVATVLGTNSYEVIY